MARQRSRRWRPRWRGTVSKSSSGWGCGPRHKTPPAVTLEGRRVKAQRFGVMLVRNNGSAGHPVLLSGSVPPPGPDTRYHARVRPGGVNKECASRLLMWRNAARSFSVEVAAYEPVLGVLSINATMCEPMELFAAVRSALLQRCEGEVAYFVSTVGLSFGTPHIDGAHVRYLFGEVKGFPQVSLFVTGIFLWCPGREGAGR